MTQQTLLPTPGTTHLVRRCATAILLFAVHITPLQCAEAQQANPTPVTDYMAEFEWGEVRDGLQMRIGTGINTELLTETQSLLYLSVQIRNVSDVSVFANFEQAVYDFEYEFDGTWYAFDNLTPVRTPLSVLLANSSYSELRSSTQSIAAGTSKSTMVTVPLTGRSPALQLHAVTGGKPARRFEPTPGPHVVRVRAARTLEPGRQTPVSNAVTVSFRTPARLDTNRQTVSFTQSKDTALRELRFDTGPADVQAFIREVLSRPPYPATSPRLITSAALEVIEPLPLYELRLPRSGTSTPPATRAYSNTWYSLILASNQVAGFIGLDPSPAGSVFNSIVSTTIHAEPVFHALQQVAGLEQVRGGKYEPRLLQVIGVGGTTPLIVLWLHSPSGGNDLYFRPRDPDVRGWNGVESEKVYPFDEFLAAARVLPVNPKHDAKWAVTIATACARKTADTVSYTLEYEQALAEIGLTMQGDRIIWTVRIPVRRDPRVISSHNEARYFVDEADGSCPSYAP